MQSNTDAPLSPPFRWRIASLVLVHLLIAAHIIHWKLAGVSMSSIQLSDAGRFTAEGVVTAAFLLFALLLAVTLVFGRFFCAWGCHMLAFQEACRFLLSRIGIRPKLVRSRLLWVVPFLGAFYIFFQPAIDLAWVGKPFPAPTLELTSGNIWATLPGPALAVVTLLIGGLMVYFLGSLSICKYVCPYGALFKLADSLALGRIRLTGECDGCGLCTAACTTGVRVHDEVQRFAMVADSGCMRCFECVSACPQDVLAYRLGRPALGVGSRAGLTRYALSFSEEVLMVGLFATSVVALHGLYEALPLLLSLAISVLAGYLGVLAWRLLRQPFVAVRGLTLKQSGRLSRAGVVFAMCVTAVFVFLTHSLFIQYHAQRARTALDALEFPRVRLVRTTEERQLAASAAAHLAFCSRYGLVDTVDGNMKLAWVYRLLAEPQLVEQHLRRAIALDPTQPAAHFNLGKELARQGRQAEAARAFAAAVQLAPSFAKLVPVVGASGPGLSFRQPAAD